MMSHWEKQRGFDDWVTPSYIFDKLGCKFDLDVASPLHKTNVPCHYRITKDSLNRNWYGFIWMNPPFGGRNAITPWLDKFFEHNNGIALSPDRTSAPWFQQAWPKCNVALFISPKVKFLRPDGSKGNSPSSGTVLFAIGLKGSTAISLASKNGLGILAYPEREKTR